MFSNTPYVLSTQSISNHPTSKFMDDTSEIPVSVPAPGKARPKADEDHSRAIELAVARGPLDRVKCVRLFDDKYRCNWWAPMAAHPSNNRAFDWSTLSTHHVRESRFITARMSDEKLEILESERT